MGRMVHFFCDFFGRACTDKKGQKNHISYLTSSDSSPKSFSKILKFEGSPRHILWKGSLSIYRYGTNTFEKIYSVWRISFGVMDDRFDFALWRLPRSKQRG